MGYTVSLQPSGRQFNAEPQESLLEAALRAGIAIAYHCSSGSCGECLARQVSGTLLQQGSYDFHLSAEQRQRGHFLLCRHAAASDLTLEVRELNHPAAIPFQRVETKVYKIDPIGDQFRVVQLRTPRSQTMQFMAGQAVVLTLESGAQWVTHIASCPCNGMILQFHLPLYEPNPFIAAFADVEAAKRLKVFLSGPFGTLSLVEQSERPLLLIAIDHHFAALKGVMEQAINLELTQPIRLYRIATMHRPHYLENYCRAWEEQIEDYRHSELNQAGDGLDRELLRQILVEVMAEFGALSGIDCYVGIGAEDLGLIERCWLQQGGRLERLYPISSNRDLAPL